MVATNRQDAVTTYLVGLVMPDSDLLVIAHFLFAVVSDKGCVVMLDMNVLVRSACT